MNRHCLELELESITKTTLTEANVKFTASELLIDSMRQVLVSYVVKSIIAFEHSRED